MMLPDEKDDAVTVLVVEDATQQALAESVLRELGIEFVTRNDPIQHLLGLGQIGGMNLAAGWPEIRVAVHDRREAEQAIREVLGEADLAEPLPELEDVSTSQSAVEALQRRYARYSLLFAILGLGGLGSLIAIHLGTKALRLRAQTPHSPIWPAVLGLTAGALSLLLWAAAWLSPQ